jgi:signal transduction histidine kinase/CheY-like chemotaxis protein
LLQAVLDILPVGVFIADATGRILQANPEAEVIWGGPIRLSSDPQQYPRDFPAWWQSKGQRLRWQEYGLARALAGDIVDVGEELRIETADRRHRTVLNYALPIKDDSGQIAGAVWVLVDITDRKRAEQTIRRANERKDKFLAVLAHELRNPLALVRSALALLGKAENDLETRRWARGLMDQQVEHIVRLVDDLLDVSRIAQGKVDLRKETVELHRLIVQAVELVQPIIESQRDLLHLSLPPEPVWIQADRVRMIQVFSNLLNNAVKYMQPEGSIHLTMRRDGNFVEVLIRDSGIGIAAEELPHVFDPFSQAQRARDRSQGGLGIGLSLVRGIMQMHGGEVTAHSEGPDRGSEFCVRMPVVDPPHQVAPQASPREGTRQRRVLVVDDQVGQAEILARLLSKFWEHDVEVAHDGPEALAAARRHRPEVILLDIDLPGMSGCDVARELRTDPDFADTLIVALTGFGQDEYRQRTHDAGFDAHLVKPASVVDLEELFAHPKLRDA